MTNDIRFPPIDPYETGMLPVDDIHTLYWEQSGNPSGVPVLFLHGGPGAGTCPDHRRFFAPSFYRIILFDQRGAGRSTPFAELKNNTIEHLIQDIEKLRRHFNINQWLIFGGSWGSTLATAYGQTHPQSCLGFILRGIFLLQTEEIDWFINGVRRFMPDTWERFVHFIPENERDDLLSAYYKRIINPDPDIHLPAAQTFSRTEGELSTLLPNPELVDSYQEEHLSLGIARMETHYFVNHQDGLYGKQLLNNMSKISHLPCIIIQGRYDLCCPPVTAYEMSKRWPKAKLNIIPDAGHSSGEKNTLKALIDATNNALSW